MNIYKKLTKDTAIFGISNFTSKFLSFILLPLYTAYLTTEEYGIVDVLNNLVVMIFPLITLSLVESILRFSFDKSINRNDILNVSVFSIICSSTLLSVLTLIVLQINPVWKQYGFLFLFMFIGYTVSTTLSYYLRGINAVKYVAFLGIIQTALVVILNVIFLLLLNLGLNGYIYSLIISYLASSIIVIYISKIFTDFSRPRLNKALLKKMLIYCIPLIPSKIAWWLNNSLDKYFIIALVGVGASGLYSVAHKIPSILTAFTDIFNQAWQLTAIDVYENVDENSPMFKDVHEVYMAASIICCGLLIALSELIGKMLFQGEFVKAWKYIPILMIAAMFSGFSGYYHSIFRATKSTKKLGITVIVGALANLILNSLMIPVWGVSGAAYATMFSFFLEWLLAYCYTTKIVLLKTSRIKTVGTFCILLIESIVVGTDSLMKYVVVLICVIALAIINKRQLIKVASKFKGVSDISIGKLRRGGL